MVTGSGSPSGCYRRDSHPCGRGDSRSERRQSWKEEAELEVYGSGQTLWWASRLWGGPVDSGLSSTTLKYHLRVASWGGPTHCGLDLGVVHRCATRDDNRLNDDSLDDQVRDAGIHVSFVSLMNLEAHIDDLSGWMPD